MLKFICADLDARPLFWTEKQKRFGFEPELAQAIAKEMGWENPIGERLISFNGDSPQELTVIGVLKDYNFESLREKT